MVAWWLQSTHNGAIMKTRRQVSCDLEKMEVTITEHTGTHSDGDFIALHTERYGIDNLNQETLNRATLHGLAQKLGDSTAGQSNEKGHTTESRFKVLDDMFAQLETVGWNKARSSAGVKLSQTQIASKMNELGLSAEQFELAKKMGLIKS